jgi:hypothetical protein
VFEGAYEKLRQQWPEFVVFKASKRAKEMSEKNKKMLIRRDIIIFWARRLRESSAQVGIYGE